MSRAAALVLGSLLSVVAGAGGAGAYLGGPVRAHIWGFEPDEKRVYYWLRAFDETGSPPEVWCLDLGTDSAAVPVRRPELESRRERGKLLPSPAWPATVERLVPLRALPRYELRLSVAADSVAVDERWNETEYTVWASVEVGDLSARVHTRAYCRPLVRVLALWEIPNRPERLAVLSVIGRAYGCEEVDRVILLR